MPYDDDGDYYELDEYGDPDYDVRDPDPEDDYDDRMTTRDDVEAPKVTPMPLLVPALPDRPARLVSFEQEIGSGAYDVANRLYAEGLSAENRVWGYHSGPSERFHVEEDGSVNGEVIYSRLRLNEPVTARQTYEAVQVVQGLLAEERVRLDSRCGFHVHVGIGYDRTSGARCYGSGAFQSVYHLWNHLEDPIFRLGSANWDFHRSEKGNDYARQTRKGLTGARGVGQYLREARHALNLEPFLRGRANCDCGAFEFGDWADCTCEHINQPTVEFRVFNATANTRKIRAYVALCLAIVAYAETHTVTPETHPVLPWSRATHSINREAVDERLRFILRDLPLTDGERDDVRYCAERAPGAMPEIVRGIRRRRGHGSIAVGV